jgi:RNA polymerase sigma-70 factor, ECF subfamily
VTKENISEAVNTAITNLTREHSGQVVAILARRLGDLDLADDAVQDALQEALRVWPLKGIPTNPPGWLLTVAKRRATDRQRRASTARRAERQANRVSEGEDDLPIPRDDLIDETPMPELNSPESHDDQLRLMLLCCHPALDQTAQVALTLRLVGGLTTTEIAAAYLTSEATLAQRIVRAKRKIRDARIPMSLPSAATGDMDGRLGSLLAVLYLMFNEAYLSRSELAPMRIDLSHEAIRLTRVVTSLPTGSAEPEGLLAMQLYAHARSETRLDVNGDLILLEDQDRTRWNLGIIREANGLVAVMMSKGRPGPYQVQALIAAQHANARTAADTDWGLIVRLYAQLVHMTPSPVVALNHAVAVAMADGPPAGLQLLNQLSGLDEYHLFHSSKGELLRRSGRTVEAAAAFGTALALTSNTAERRLLQQRIDKLLAV